jgi:membrane-associated protein
LETIKHFIDLILHLDKLVAYVTSQAPLWSYIVLFIIIFAETGFVVTPFLPGDSLLFAMGALIAADNSGLSIVVLGVILIIAAFAGNSVNYLIGNYVGPKVFKENNRILKLEYYTQTQAFFDKHGGKAVIFSRFMPIIRTIAPFVAGVGRMNFGRYSLYNFIGGTAWIILFLAAGYALGNISFIKTHISLVGLVIILISIVPPIIAAVRSRKAKKSVA